MGRGVNFVELNKKCGENPLEKTGFLSNYHNMKNKEAEKQPLIFLFCVWGDALKTVIRNG